MRTRNLAVVVTLTSALATLLAAPRAQAAAPPPDVNPATQRPAATWETAMSQPAFDSYLPRGRGDYLLVGAGAPSPELDAVVGVLGQRVRGGSSGRTLLGSDWLTATPEDDDAAIVAATQAAAVSPDVIIIARLFETDLVVSFYDPKGEVLDGFILSQGDVLSTRTGSGSTGGVTQEAAEAVMDVVESGTEQATEEYEDDYLHYRQAAYMNPYTGEVGVRETDQILRGNSSRVLSIPQALRHMGHTDLADTYETRGRVKAGLIVTGSILISALPIGGALLAFGPEFTGLDNHGAVAGGVLAVGIAGGAMLITGSVLRRGVTGNEMRDHVADYNRELERPKESNTDEADPPSASLRFAPVVSRSGGGLVLSGRF